MLSSAQNRLIVGLVMIGAGLGFIASACLKEPTRQHLTREKYIPFYEENGR